MQVDRTHIQNFRAFKEVAISLDSRLNVFFGVNSVGKTNLLEAFCCALSRFFPYCSTPKLKHGAKPFLLDDINSWSKVMKNGRLVKDMEKFATISLTLTSSTSRLYQWTAFRLSDIKFKKDLMSYMSFEHEFDVYIPHALVNDVYLESCGPSDFAQEMMMQENGSQRVPVLAYYGPHRGAAQGSRKRFSKKKIDFTNPFAAYYRALEPSLDFDLFLEWFNEEEAAELRAMREDPSYCSHALDAVRTALSIFLSDNDYIYEDLRFVSNPKRLVMNRVLSDGRRDVVDFDQLSDGYRSSIALVADFARRLSIANQYAEISPLEGEGVLLIDEVEVHLHPRWQASVLPSLRRCFPNVQIIATTHAPLVLAGVEDGKVFRLSFHEDSGSSVSQLPHPLAGYSVEHILPELMDVSPRVPSKMQDELDAYLSAILSGDDHLPEWQKCRQDLFDYFGESHPLIQSVLKQEGLAQLKVKIEKARPVLPHA